MNIRESGEMYLETIYVLSQTSSSVRGIDVGAYMGFSKPSVSRALSLLRNEGLVKTDEAGFIKLTEKGEEKAKRIYERHMILSELFMTLGDEEKNATEDGIREMLSKYVKMLTDKPIKVTYYSVENGG